MKAPERECLDAILQGVVSESCRAALEARSIKAIVDFEVKANRKKVDWSFSHGGFDSLADDFFILNEYLSAAGHERLVARLHITPHLGRVPLQKLTPQQVQAWLNQLQKEGAFAQRPT